jgi:putative transposon-encoded protein
MKKSISRKGRLADRVAVKPMELRISGYEVVEKRADLGGTSGRIYVPKSWVGKLVRAIRIER